MIFSHGSVPKCYFEIFSKGIVPLEERRAMPMPLIQADRLERGRLLEAAIAA